MTRPPETYVVLKGKGPELFFRDSHRQSQRDFVGVGPFLEWVRHEPSFFAPMPQLPPEQNMISLNTLVETVEMSIAEATAVETYGFSASDAHYH